MTSFTALFDANILYPAPLRDLLIELSTAGLFRAKWSDTIHDEWISSLLANRPELKAEDLARTRAAMDAAVLDCLVANYDGLIASLDLPDQNDRHVLAAAIRGRADIIVTMNKRDFPEPELSKYSIQIQHPDDFVSDLLSLAPEVVFRAIRNIRSRLKNPPKSAEEYLDTLERMGLTITVSQLRKFIANL
ncbi:MAG: PIN domain-containing protein [Bdellovibrio sp.]|nr:MAG: PIN domain-containing protein [Bdellovibrio sp.]